MKWLSEINVQEDAYLGKWQARNYRTLKGEMINGEMKWVESAISRMRLKSFVARVTKTGGMHKVLGVVLHDGTPIKSVEVRVDDGPWQPAAIDVQSGMQKHAWKLFTYNWKGATPGEHTLISRVTDINGKVQPTAEDLANKKTFLEDNSQTPRKITITSETLKRAIGCSNAYLITPTPQLLDYSITRFPDSPSRVYMPASDSRLPRDAQVG